MSPVCGIFFYFVLKQIKFGNFGNFCLKFFLEIFFNVIFSRVNKTFYILSQNIPDFVREQILSKNLSGNMSRNRFCLETFPEEMKLFHTIWKCSG